MTHISIELFFMKLKIAIVYLSGMFMKTSEHGGLTKQSHLKVHLVTVLELSAVQRDLQLQMESNCFHSWVFFGCMLALKLSKKLCFLPVEPIKSGKKKNSKQLFNALA